MDSAVSMNISPIQLMLAMAFQIWLIAFPVIILKRLSKIEKKLDELIVEEIDDSSHAENH